MDSNNSLFQSIGNVIDKQLQSNTEVLFMLYLVFIFFAIVTLITLYTTNKFKKHLYKFSLTISAVSVSFMCIRYYYDIKSDYIFYLSFFSTSLFVIIGFLYKNKRFEKEQEIKNIPLAFIHFESNFEYAVNSIAYKEKEYKNKYDNIKYSNGAKINHENFQRYLLLRYSTKYSKINELLAKVYKNIYKSFSENYLKQLYKLQSEIRITVPVKIALELRSEANNEYDKQLNISNLSFEKFYNEYLISSEQKNYTSERIFIIDSNIEKINIGLIKKMSKYKEVKDNHTKNNVLMYCISKVKAEDIKTKYNNSVCATTSLDFSINIDKDGSEENTFIIVNYGLHQMSTRLMPKDIDGVNLSIIHENKKSYIELFALLKKDALFINENEINANNT